MSKTLWLLCAVAIATQAARADMVVWMNGGGSVDKAAQIHPTAFIGKGSQIGPCAVVKEKVVISNTTVTCEAKNDFLYVAERALVSHSNLNVGNIGRRAVLDNVMSTEKIEVRDHATAADVVALGKIEIRDRAVASSIKTAKGTTVEIRDGAVVRNSQFLAGDSEIRENARVIGSKFNGSMVRDFALVVDSSPLPGSSIEEFEVKVNQNANN